jgi:Flp pilus assembly pilin Flp
MQRLRNSLAELAVEESGATVVEYAVVICLLVGTIAAGSIALSGGLQGQFGRVSGGMDGSHAAMNGSPTSSAAASTLFADSFGKPGKPEQGQWTFSGKDWTYSKGQLWAGTPERSDERRAFAEGSHSRNYTVTVDATLVYGKGYGVFVRASGERVNGYSFQYERDQDGGEFKLVKWVNGYLIWPPVVSEKTQKNYQVNGVRRQVEVSALDDNFAVKINGKTVLEGRDDTHREGKAGLRVWGAGQTRFHAFSVKEPEEQQLEGTKPQEKKPEQEPR